MRKDWVVPLFVVGLLLGWDASLRAESQDSRTAGDKYIPHLSQSKWAKSLRNLQFPLGRLTVAEGYSYFSVIPFVTTENDTRTNLGLNNFSEFSLSKGANPAASVVVLLIDQQGLMHGEGIYVVQSNEMKQINNVISDLRGDIETGWLLILSDEPLTAWASVIFNSSNDPSIQLASEYGAQRLMIQSSAKTTTLESSLVITNIGPARGKVAIKIYDNNGRVIESKTRNVPPFGMYVENDIRGAVPQTFGQIVIESMDEGLLLVANSVVKSSDGTGAFFPATPLPSTNTKSIAGTWVGNLIGTRINTPIRITLFQEGARLFGNLEMEDRGSFPTASKEFSITGSIENDGALDRYFFQLDESFDAKVNFFSFSMRAALLSGPQMGGKFLYVDESKQTDVGALTLMRAGGIIIIPQ